MNRANWKDVAEMIGIAAIVASLVFVGIEMRQSQAIANAELQQEMITARIARNDQLSTYAEVLSRANLREELSSSEELIVVNLVDSLWADAFFGQRRWEYVDHPAVDAPVRGFAVVLHQNPGLRQAWSIKQRRMARGRALSGDSRVAEGRSTAEYFDQQVDDYLQRFDKGLAE